MRLRSSGPSPQWLLGICCPLGMQVTLEPHCLCGHGTVCVLYGKHVNALENFAPDRLPCSWCWAEEAGGGRGGSCVAENCPVHFTKGKTVHFDWLSAAIHAGGVSVSLDTPWPVRCHPRSLHPPMALGDRDGRWWLHRGKWIIAKLSIQQ